jgi:predicted GNAT family acetyltransferase
MRLGGPALPGWDSGIQVVWLGEWEPVRCATKEGSAMEVVDRPEFNRFELTDDGSVAELRYETHGSTLVLTHTGVPDQLAGRGVGGLLVQAAIARATRDGLDIVPLCPYARTWIDRHPEALGPVHVAG